MSNEKNLFEGMKEDLRKQFEEIYMEGVHSGAITTCATLFQTMQIAGLEEENIFFTILKDLAKLHGCENLPAFVKEMQNKTTTNIPS